MPLSKIEQSSVNSGVAGTGPAFSAYLSANQSISGATTTLIQFNSEIFDTNNAFNNTGSTVGTAPQYSFNPQVAGYYQVNVFLVGTNATYYLFTQLNKNGGLYQYGSMGYGASSIGNFSTLNAVVYLNGSTDYLQFYGFQSTGGNFYGTAGNTMVSASLIRAA